jgi:hypothetical protein
VTKAVKNTTTTTWILLRDARALVVGVYQAPRLAEQLLKAGQIRWRCIGMEGHKRSSDPGPGDPGFWQVELASPPLPSGARQLIKVLAINWGESSAVRKISPMHGYTAFRIEVPEEDVLAVLPAAMIADPVVATVSATGAWVINMVKRKKAVGEIPANIRITAFAKLIHGWMGKMAKSDATVPRVGWKYIKNSLPAWGLWPISSIK